MIIDDHKMISWICDEDVNFNNCYAVSYCVFTVIKFRVYLKSSIETWCLICLTCSFLLLHLFFLNFISYHRFLQASDDDHNVTSSVYYEGFNDNGAISLCDYVGTSTVTSY